MKRTIGAVGVLLAAVLGLVGVSGQSSTQAVPRFQVDPTWPKVPSQWILGIVSSAAVDSQDHIWVLQRPLTLTPEEKSKAAPPVLEFDDAGNFVQGWGGPGAGYDWPESEHGIYVDPRGFVWIGGQGEQDQLLKFTKSGKFVMQIGKGGQKKSNTDTKNLWKPADVFVYQKTNELFVADGYGNKRIIVFDADTGAFKRMWGAFGKAPTDGPGVPGAAEDGPPQFGNPVHAVKVSNDGLVYVGDRGGKRVQVFTIDGKFVSQQFIAPESERIPPGTECKAPECTPGNTAAGVAFSPDPEQRFLYVGNRSQARVMVFNRKTFELLDSFGRWGSAPGEFGTLHHVAVDSQGNLYVAEVSPLRPVNRRIQKFTFRGMS
jgi:DNA-binding beta-propeller fold protein YncE